MVELDIGLLVPAAEAAVDVVVGVRFDGADRDPDPKSMLVSSCSAELLESASESEMSPSKPKPDAIIFQPKRALATFRRRPTRRNNYNKQLSSNMIWAVSPG